MDLESIGKPVLYVGFGILVLIPLALDLGVFNRKAHTIRFREAAIWTAVWVSLATVFGFGVHWRFGSEKALQFATGYVIELALAVDNLFVFVAIFTYFAVPAAYQHRVLFWGILGALAMRAGFIFAGSVLVAKFHWILYVFGLILIATAIKLMLNRGAEVHPERNPIFRWFRRIVPSTSEYHGAQLWVKEHGNWFATPLFLVLVSIEITDLVFAFDSIPAIFAITHDPFIIYTSNIFAILGLRSMYFLLSGMVDKFHHLQTGLALVLAFVGTKMLIADLYKIPIVASLYVVAALILGSVVLSLLLPKKEASASAGSESE